MNVDKYKRVASIVRASKIVKIEERKMYEDLPLVQCWLIMQDGSEIRCHRQKECKCPVIGDYKIQFYENEKPFHMSKDVFERQFIKLNIIDKLKEFFKEVRSKRG
jgi:hypothetical protein